MKKESNAKYYEKYINHTYVFLAYSLLFSFVAFVANFILSTFVINPKYFLGEDHFIPLGIIPIFSILLAEFFYRRYLKKIYNNSESADIDSGN